MRSRITFANVTSVLALFFALGGSAYALSVSGDDVVNNSLTGADVAKNSLKASDIAGLGASVVVRQGTPVTGSQLAGASADCNKGETLISGGYQLAGNVLPTVVQDRPAQSTGTPTLWSVIAFLNSPPPGASFTVSPFALCAS